MSANILLISVQDIKDRTGLHANVDEKQIFPDIKYVQDSFLTPILGTALMLKLQSDISGGLPTGNYLTLWRDYIKDALCYYTLAESPMSLTLQLYNKGLVRKSSENTLSPDMQEIIDASNRFRNRAEWYGQRLANYLNANSSLFPEYCNPGSSCDTIQPEDNAYKTCFFLGNYRKKSNGMDY